MVGRIPWSDRPTRRLRCQLQRLLADISYRLINLYVNVSEELLIPAKLDGTIVKFGSGYGTLTLPLAIKKYD